MCKWQERYQPPLRVKHCMELEHISSHSAPMRSCVSTVETLLVTLSLGIAFPWSPGTTRMFRISHCLCAGSHPFCPTFTPGSAGVRKFSQMSAGSASPLPPLAPLPRGLAGVCRNLLGAQALINLSMTPLPRHGATLQVQKQRQAVCLPSLPSGR